MQPLLDECRPLEPKYFYEKKIAVLPTVVDDHWIWFRTYWAKKQTHSGSLSYASSTIVDRTLSVEGNK